LLALTIAFVQAQQIFHPGQCPRQATRGPCVKLCDDDGGCDRDAKCCDTGCGQICKKINGNQQGQGGPFAAVERPPAVGQRQQFGQQSIGANGGRNLSPQQQFLLQQQQQQQLLGQPSLVNIGGCSRGVSLRNSDGSTLVCGFGPRDFACPPSFACTFDNSLRALVCCPSENTTQSSSSPTEEGANPCHEGEPIRNEFGNRLKCDLAGGPTSVCPAGTLCVVGACCPVSVAGLISVKPGKCPQPLPAAPGATCQNDCTFDADCPGPAKCCFVGCGAKCVASTIATTNDNGNGNGNGQSGLGGPLNSNGASISQFGLVPTRNDGIFQQRQFNAQQNFQFPNNGPPAFNNGLRGPPGSNQFGNGQQQQQQQQQRQFGNGGPQQPRPPQFQPINTNRQFDQTTE